MKFVFLGYDFMLPVAYQLMDFGHELAGIMSFPCDQVFSFNHNCKIIAKQKNATYIESPITDVHIDSFIRKGVKAFISAGYPQKIPPIDETKAYGINIHPSYLPYARGAMPVPHIILNKLNKAAGYTIHKLAPEFDAGDILHQEHVTLDEDESVEKYCAKVLAHSPQHMSRILADIENQWPNAKPQNHKKSSYFKLPTTEMRTLDWNQSVKDILRTANAFGRFGSHAVINKIHLHVFACEGWKETHGHKPGTCLSLQNNMAIIAAKDGFIVLKEFREKKS